MGNSCPPCQCNTDSDRPYYDLMKVSLKQMQCMPEDTSRMTQKQNDEYMDCMKKHQTDLTAALKKTDCPNVKFNSDFSKECMETLTTEKQNNALKECEDAVSDYLKTPGGRTSFKSGPPGYQIERSVNQLCSIMFEVKPPKI